MGKKATYISLTAIAIFIIFLGFIFKVSYITTFYYSIAAHMQELFIIIPAAICALLFANSGTYWVNMLVLSGVDAVLFRLYHHLSLTNLTAIGMIMATFLVVVFGINLIRVILRG